MLFPIEEARKILNNFNYKCDFIARLEIMLKSNEDKEKIANNVKDLEELVEPQIMTAVPRILASQAWKDICLKIKMFVPRPINNKINNDFKEGFNEYGIQELQTLFDEEKYEQFDEKLSILVNNLIPNCINEEETIKAVNIIGMVIRIKSISSTLINAIDIMKISKVYNQYKQEA